jgi:hypothetical protein
MDTLVFKVVASPLLIQAASLAGRRWGPAVGGWLVGLPLTSGPVALFLAVDQGAGFAATAAAGSLTGTAAQAGFCLAYGFAARRHSWQAALSAGTGAFAAIALVLEALRLPLWALLLVVELSLAAALFLAPRQANADELVPAPPRWDIPARMVVATILILVLTSAAPFVGARLAGLLATFPVFAAVLAIFAYRAQGHAAAQRVVHDLLLGLFAFSGFFIVIALTIERIGIVAAFATASFAAGAIQASTLRMINGSRASGPCRIGCG